MHRGGANITTEAKLVLLLAPHTKLSRQLATEENGNRDHRKRDGHCFWKPPVYAVNLLLLKSQHVTISHSLAVSAVLSLFCYLPPAGGLNNKFKK